MNLKHTAIRFKRGTSFVLSVICCLFLNQASAETGDKISNNNSNTSAESYQGINDISTQIENAIKENVKNNNVEQATGSTGDQVKATEDAPKSFKSMVSNNVAGNRREAEKHADGFVRYMSDLMFQVRDLTTLIGEAMVRQGQMKEEEWVGAEQFINREMAIAREEEGNPFKITHDSSLEKIEKDQSGKVEIYFFFDIQSKFCRETAKEVEKLRLVLKNDPNVRIAGAVIGEEITSEWVEPFKEFTGFEGQIFNGTDVAKKLRIGFVPAVVFISPSTKASYIRSGYSGFARLYQIARKIQGKSIELNPALAKFADTPIEKIKKSKITLYENMDQGENVKNGIGKF